MSLSFGVATASLVTSLFIPNHNHATSAEMIEGMHQAFLILGGLTVLSAIGFLELRDGDGDNVSRRHESLAHGAK
jgi:hypothetical protein